MTINYTSLLGLAQPVTGTESGTWGTVVNDEITALVEQAVAGGTSISVTSGNVTLTDTDGVSNQARNAILLVTGTPGTSRNVIAPSSSKVYVVINGSDSAIVLKGAATTGITIPTGTKTIAFWDGSDFVSLSSSVFSIFGTSAAGGAARFYEDTDNGTNYIALQAPAAVASNVSFTLPNADGTNGQVIQTNGSGVLSFTTPSSGISTGKSIAMALIFGF
jgi:hypothetical protein